MRIAEEMGEPMDEESAGARLGHRRLTRALTAPDAVGSPRRLRPASAGRSPGRGARRARRAPGGAARRRPRGRGARRRRRCRQDRAGPRAGRPGRAAPRGAPRLRRRLPPAAAQRYARGRTAETFYRDSYDHDAIRDRLVEPFRAGEPWVRAVHDVEREVVLDLGARARRRPDAAARSSTGSSCTAPSWPTSGTLSVWLEVPFEVSVPRGNARFGDGGRRGGRPGIRGERPLRRRAAALPRRGRPGRAGDLGARQHRPRGAGAHG